MNEVKDIVKAAIKAKLEEADYWEAATGPIEGAPGWVLDFVPGTHNIYDQRRWTTSWEIISIVRNEDTGEVRYYEISWEEGSTEYQDGAEKNWYVSRVMPKEVTKIVYVSHKESDV